MIYRLLFKDLELSVDCRSSRNKSARSQWEFKLRRCDFHSPGLQEPERHELGIIYVSRAIYAEARLLPFAEARVYFRYRNGNDPIVPHLHQRYELRTSRSPRTRSMGLSSPSALDSRLLVAILLPVQTNAITTIVVMSNCHPSMKTAREDVSRLPALQRIILRPGNWYEWKFTSESYVDRLRNAVGKSIRVIT
jgi:hypothetical protein